MKSLTNYSLSVILVLSCFILHFSCTSDNGNNSSKSYQSTEKRADPIPTYDDLAIDTTYSKEVNTETKVLICQGGYSYAYHKYYCRGLKNCKASIEKVSINSAVNYYERKPCKICYNSSNTNNTIETNKAYTNKSNTSNSPCIRVGAICNDGTRSSATGRGACSHHGGVRNWICK